MNEFQKRVGVGEPSRAFMLKGGGAATITRPVIADEGPRRGQPVGSITEHWSGRVDAIATPDPIRTTSRSINHG